MVIVSPHLDDAVFSCGHFMATHPGCTVITVFAGIPSAHMPAPDWDTHCGFRSAREAVLARREEDQEALSLLQATPIWLDFLDSQYDQPVPEGALKEALQTALQALDTALVLLPLGLFHSDHLLTHQVALQAIAAAQAGSRSSTVRLYEEVPYRKDPEQVRQRLQRLRHQGLRLSPEVVRELPPHPSKVRAARCYASQVRAMGGPLLAALEMPEVSWTLQSPLSPDRARDEHREVRHEL